MSWLFARLEAHRIALESVRKRHALNWRDNIESDPRTLVQDPPGASTSELRELRDRLPALPVQLLEFLREGAGLCVFGYHGIENYRFASPPEIRSLAHADPEFVDRWRKQVNRHIVTPPYRPLADQNPHAFNPDELRAAIVLASAPSRHDHALLWLPEPRGEYWQVAAWDGCQRFLSIESAVDRMLTDVVNELESALE